MNINKPKVCCQNCKYYWANAERGFCTIDQTIIDVELSRIRKCNAYEEWWGAVE